METKVPTSLPRTATSAPAGYQAEVYQELRELAADYFDYDWTTLPVTPRTNVLICGATGCGKTYLCRHLAKQLRLPIIDLEYANWVVTGASVRGALQTLRLLYRFIEQNDRGIIVLDELDKVGSSDATSDWTRSVHLEVFSVLDRRILAGVIEGIEANDDKLFVLTSEQLEQRLRTSYLIIGAGAWQHLWHPSATAGFSREVTPESAPPEYKQLVQSVRPEILNRFRSDLLFLPPLARGGYVALLNETLLKLPVEFAAIMRDRSERTIDEAVTNQRGYRWIETLVSDAIRQLRIGSLPPVPVCKPHSDIGD